MLETVTIQSSRAERPQVDRKHVMSDVELTGDYLRSTNQYDLLTAMRGRVPGLQITYIMNPTTGEVKKFLTFPGNMTWNGMAEPMVELDGIVLTAFAGESIADRLANMSVQEIESVTVLRHASSTAYGVRAFNGVIVIKTRVGSRTMVEKPKLDRSKMQHVNMRGYSTVAEFSSPEYSDHTNGDDRTDYRSTIYWNPVAFTDGKEPLMLSFYAADIPTRYRIVVEGVTQDGEAVRGEKIIVVTGKK